MKPTTLGLLPIFVAVCVSGAPASQGRDLIFEDRVRAQEAIERVSYSHQLGATKRFEEAVPRRVLENKVNTYLDQSVALERYWHRPVTAEMLRREIERMARGSRMPDRLREMYAALGNDAFVIQECLGRATLVDRLARSFFAFDASIHGEAQRTVEALHRDLVARRIDPFSVHPSRSVMNVVRMDARGGAVAGAETNRLELSPEDFERWQAKLSADVGAIGPWVQEREAFVIRVVLDRKAGAMQVATYTVPKKTWQDWWSTVEGTLDGGSVVAVASSDVEVPAFLRATASSSCIPADTWDNGSLDDHPERSAHTAVWTGREMILWGGYSNGYLGSGLRYDPATDTSTSISSVGAPQGRSGHTALWTGERMIVWGGLTGNTYFNTGGQYDPVADAWTPTSTAGAPAPRYAPRSVWTGTEMLVWGGSEGAKDFGTGGRYDPRTDSWTPISTTGAPTARYQHTAVWTGDRMVVWGGWNDITSFDTGGRYDPATDTWTPTSIVGAPAPSRGHTAVWTGSSMVVWGGGNTGGRYDPAPDAWMPTSTVDAPEARTFHTAIWTGASMIVWGGLSSGFMNTGGRYDPTADTWAPTSLIDAPEGRYFHTAVWTGDLMIVWGGNLGYLNSGGRYAPGSCVASPP